MNAFQEYGRFSFKLDVIGSCVNLAAAIVFYAKSVFVISGVFLLAAIVYALAAKKDWNLWRRP